MSRFEDRNYENIYITVYLNVPSPRVISSITNIYCSFTQEIDASPRGKDLFWTLSLEFFLLRMYQIISLGKITLKFPDIYSIDGMIGGRELRGGKRK